MVKKSGDITSNESDNAKKKKFEFPCVHSQPYPQPGWWTGTRKNKYFDEIVSSDTEYFKDRGIYTYYNCFYGNKRCPGYEFDRCGGNWQGALCGRCGQESGGYQVQNKGERAAM